jgi:integrase/recombinase XerD
MGEAGGEVTAPSELVQAATAIVVQARRDDDEQLVQLWVGKVRSAHSKRAYLYDSSRFFAFIRKPLRAVVFADLLAYAAHLKSLSISDGTRYKAMSAIKRLFAFAAGLGYLPIDVARPLQLPGAKDTLTERILEEEDVQRLIAGESSPRNKLMLQLLYLAGVRVDELIGLCWRDLQVRRGGGGQITVFGKGRKTRAIRLDGAIWPALMAARGSAADDAPVFPGRGGARMNPSTVLRVVKAAAARVGITKPVSPHWMRHCHASHALDRGAPLSLVQQTLGHSSIATTSRYLHARPNESSSKFLPPI